MLQASELSVWHVTPVIPRHLNRKILRNLSLRKEELLFQSKACLSGVVFQTSSVSQLLILFF
jgi:hypothetical protein